ncbi:DNA-binding transcriptional regulator, MarR family [Microbulbifer marinus]|uniref:DNA-binding transcriptional regulator, MarR family n=2 Tax=Microbulbifer marinus TaxID=658218 RepID=A0A1H4BBJ0_9GAMM|nr:DNA-binding transcriptional regulator, MarR family [Microbulbifer marinus]
MQFDQEVTRSHPQEERSDTPTRKHGGGRDAARQTIDKRRATPKVGRTQLSRRELQSLLLMDKIEEVLTTLRRLIRATDLHSKQLVKTAGLTAPQLLLLQAIREKGQVTIGALAKEISLSQATVTTILDRLEKRGLVYRERSSEDKRKVHAYLTDKGIEILRDAPTPLQEHFVRQFRDLRDWEQSMIISSLQRVALMMDAEHIDASPVLDVGDLDRKDSRQLPPGEQEDKDEH